MKRYITIVLALLSCSAFAAEERLTAERIQELQDMIGPTYITYLTIEANEIFQSDACEEHATSDYSTEEQEMLELAYTVEYCASLIRLRDSDYARGWRLHALSARLVNTVPCDCPLHPHADNLAHGAYLKVKELLDAGNEVSNIIEEYCVELAPVDSSPETD